MCISCLLYASTVSKHFMYNNPVVAFIAIKSECLGLGTQQQDFLKIPRMIPICSKVWEPLNDPTR